MPTAFVLYLDHSKVGPAFELLRKFSNPLASGQPHITIRYPVDRLRWVRPKYLRISVPSIDLVEPGAFGDNADASGRNTTVFIRCASHQLEGLEYKPKFPFSVFHLTIYDGSSGDFARSLMTVLDAFKWHRQLTLPADTHLTEISIGVSKSRRSASPTLTDSAARLLSEVAPGVEAGSLATLDAPKRLELTRYVCQWIHENTLPVPSSPHTTEPITQLTLPGGLWPDDAPRTSSTPHRSRSIATRASRQSTRTETRQLGMFLTPPELAVDIARAALDALGEDTGIHFGDPALGAGTFFKALSQLVPASRVASAIGVELDPFRFIDDQRAWSSKGLEIVPGDFLHMADLPRRNLILANPPYVRHQDIPTDYKRALRERASLQTGSAISGLSGLYVYFLLLSHAWMRDDGVAAWLIPSEFTDSLYGAAVRAYLSKAVQLIRLHLFDADDVQFENARVSSVVVIFQKRQSSPEGHTTVTKGGSLSRPKLIRRIAVRDLRHASGWRHLAEGTSEPSVSGVRLGDVFRVRRGIATGANAYFVMTRDQAAQRRLPNEALRPVLPRARMLTTDVVERDADGYPNCEPKLCVLDCDIPEDELCRRFPTMRAYLDKGRDLGIPMRHVVRERHPWYKQEVRDPAPFLCTYMGRTKDGGPPLRFLRNESDATALNTYLLLYPSPSLARMLQGDSGRTDEVFAILKCAAHTVLRHAGRIYGDGLHKIEPRELQAIPLGEVPSWLSALAEARLPIAAR